MKQVLLLISLGFLFSQAEIDTTEKLPVIDFSKSFNIPGIIPKQMLNSNNRALFPYEIEAIKQKARNYDPEPVTNDDIVIMETNRGTMKLKLFRMWHPGIAEISRNWPTADFMMGLLSIASSRD